MSEFTVAMSAIVSDEYCLAVLKAMRHLHRKGMAWLNPTEISETSSHLSTEYVRAALYKMASMGFLYIRDGDGNETLAYQLRREYRK